MPSCVYLPRCRDGSVSTGITADLACRAAERFSANAHAKTARTPQPLWDAPDVTRYACEDPPTGPDGEP